MPSTHKSKPSAKDMARRRRWPCSSGKARARDLRSRGSLNAWPATPHLATCDDAGLIAVNYAARARGITRHMRVQQALAACPELVLVHVQTIGAEGTQGAGGGATASEPPASPPAVLAQQQQQQGYGAGASPQGEQAAAAQEEQQEEQREEEQQGSAALGGAGGLVLHPPASGAAQSAAALGAAAAAQEGQEGSAALRDETKACLQRYRVVRRFLLVWQGLGKLSPLCTADVQGQGRSHLCAQQTCKGSGGCLRAWATGVGKLARVEDVRRHTPSSRVCLRVGRHFLCVRVAQASSAIMAVIGQTLARGAVLEKAGLDEVFIDLTPMVVSPPAGAVRANEREPLSGRRLARWRAGKCALPEAEQGRRGDVWRRFGGCGMRSLSLQRWRGGCRAGPGSQGQLHGSSCACARVLGGGGAQDAELAQASPSQLQALAQDVQGYSVVEGGLQVDVSSREGDARLVVGECWTAAGRTSVHMCIQVPVPVKFASLASGLPSLVARARVFSGGHRQAHPRRRLCAPHVRLHLLRRHCAKQGEATAHLPARVARRCAGWFLYARGWPIHQRGMPRIPAHIARLTSLALPSARRDRPPARHARLSARVARRASSLVSLRAPRRGSPTPRRQRAAISSSAAQDEVPAPAPERAASQAAGAGEGEPGARLRRRHHARDVNPSASPNRSHGAGAGQGVQREEQAQQADAAAAARRRIAHAGESPRLGPRHHDSTDRRG